MENLQKLDLNLFSKEKRKLKMTNWKFKYFEKTIKESHVHLFSNLEIKNYLKKLLNDQGLTLNDYQINLSDSTVHVFVSISCIPQKQKLKHKKIYKKNQEKITLPSQQKQMYLIAKHYKMRKEKKLKLRTFQISKTMNFFQTKIIESIKTFLGNRYNIIITIEKLKLTPEKDKNIIFKLRRFHRTDFFKQGTSILLTFISKPNSERLLTQFIAKELALTKRHKFFLSFLKENFNILINQKFSKIQGIKLIIKGRLNNVMRANSYVVKMGKIPLISLHQNLTYSETTSYGKNGTLGVKLWVFRKF